jgi:hypothetical protein
LKYADRARSIQNKPVVNVDSVTQAILQLRKQVELLEDELKKYRRMGKLDEKVWNFFFFVV